MLLGAVDKLGNALFIIYCFNADVVAVTNTYRDDISNGYSIPDEKPTIGYSMPPIAFSSVNWCKIDVFTLNIIPLHHKKSQTINNNKNTK